MPKQLSGALLDARLPKMTTSALYRRVRSVLKHASASIATYLAYCRDGYAAAARYEELSRLSNAELARRGLARGDLSRRIFKELEERWTARSWGKDGSRAWRRL